MEKLLLFFSLFLLFFLIGCIESPPEDKPIILPDSARPAILLTKPEGLEKWSYSEKDNSYVLEISKPWKSELNWHYSVMYYSDKIYFAYRDEIVRYDLSLNEEISKPIQNVGAISNYKGNILISVGNSLWIMDKDLKKIGEKNFLDSEGTIYESKAIHDILPYNNKAFLLDNVMGPFYFFIADISDPGNPKELFSELDEGVNIGLGPQWIYQKENVWAILKRQTTMGGANAQIMFYTLDGVRVGSQQLYNMETWEQEPKGIFISSVASLSSNYALIRNNMDYSEKETEYILFKMNYRQNKIDFEEIIEVPFDNPTTWPILIKPYGGDKIAALMGDNLLLINPKKKEILFTAKLSAYARNFVVLN